MSVSPAAKAEVKADALKAPVKKTTISFQTTDGRKAAVSVRPEELEGMTMVDLMRLAEKRFHSVFGEVVRFESCVSQTTGQLANTDLVEEMWGGALLTMLCGSEDYHSVGAGRSRKSTRGTFCVIEKPVVDLRGVETGEIETTLRIDDRNTASYLGQIMQNSEDLYKPSPKISLEKFLPILEPLKLMARQDSYKQYLGELSQFVENHFAATVEKIASLRAAGKISYSTLWSLFDEGSKCYGLVNDQIVAMTVSRYEYHGGLFPGFSVTGLVVKSDGSRLLETDHSFFCPKFGGVICQSDLPCRPMTDELYVQLTERGRRFMELALGSKYALYQGHMLYRLPRDTRRFKADGRIMIDGVSFNQINPNYTEFKPNPNSIHGRGGQAAAVDRQLTKLSDIKLFSTWPTIGGFSFQTKKWGEVIVDFVQPLVFDPLAFERLVLPAETKTLIQALVEKQSETIADIIQGKGGGCIFLLHGPPGVGKTLTAESISEHLKRPLYSISVGELGTNCETLERSLTEVLEVASRWNAVILLDEADIFLERRNMNDINRNALVGIFLRLLEYHSGVLFLTSNRVKSFDPAFHSRISMALRYPALNEQQRMEIWSQLLIFAGLGDAKLNVKELAKYQLNGRQIRTIIKLASSIALQEGVAVEQVHFDRCIRIADQFRRDLKQSGLEIDFVEGDLSSSHSELVTNQ